jgi:hypothetical protein
MVLLLKCQNAECIKDYHPISLIHVLGKLFSKVLANHLAPKLDDLIHVTQSVFIKGCYIQGNFLFVQASAKLLHASCQLPLLLKVDISRVFDSVCWLFLLEVMAFVGFPTAWQNGSPSCSLRKAQGFNSMVCMGSVSVMHEGYGRLIPFTNVVHLGHGDFE